MNSQQCLTIDGVEVDVAPRILKLAEEGQIQRQLRRGIRWALNVVRDRARQSSGDNLDRFDQVVSFRVMGPNVPAEMPEELYFCFHEDLYLVREPK